MKRRDQEEDLKNIPSMSLSEDDVDDYHRHASERFTMHEHHVELASPASTTSLWITLLVVLMLVLTVGYFVFDLRSQLSMSQAQLQTTTTQIEQLASTDKQVSSTGNTLQDQLKLTKSDVKSLQDDLKKLQADNKTVLDQQTKMIATLDKKITDMATQLDENKTALSATQEALKKNQPDADTAKQAAQLKALEAKVNDLSVDVMAKQEQGAGAGANATATAGDSQKAAQIDEQLKSIDTFRQTVNASITKMQADINKLFIDVDDLK